MRILLVNGSPHEKGCTYTALSEAAAVFEENGFETMISWVGNKSISGCFACHGCKGVGKCVFNDKVNELIEMAKQSDGFLFGSPVHFASASGALTSLMDRLFYAGKQGSCNPFAFKPAACVLSARRAGTTAAFDQLNKYFTISEMPVISSRYWNMVHGNTPEEVQQDKEGLQSIRILARNMIWFLRCKEAGVAAGIPFPEKETIVQTNFIS